MVEISRTILKHVGSTPTIQGHPRGTNGHLWLFRQCVSVW